MEPTEKEEEQKNVGATTVLPKITTAGYASLDVSLRLSF
jgi:obg-like ATPase 1